MRKIHMYVTGHTEFNIENRPTYYRCILADQESEKTISLPIPEVVYNSTPNQAIIQGVIDGLSSLKYPCAVTVFSKGSFGISKLDKPKGPNKEFLKNLREVIKSLGHMVDFNVDSESVELQMKDWGRILKLNLIPNREHCSKSINQDIRNLERYYTRSLLDEGLVKSEEEAVVLINQALRNYSIKNQILRKCRKLVEEKS